MPGCVLYSTNVYLKYYIHKHFYDDIHYVWCSELFDATKAGAYTASSHNPPTSNPADIYRDLKQAVARGDRHNDKIKKQILTLKGRASKSRKDGRITDDQKKKIHYLISNCEFEMWRPLIYIIPYQLVAGKKLIEVPIQKRANPAGMEYIIEDLQGSEFDVIEV